MNCIYVDKKATSNVTLLSAHPCRKLLLQQLQQQDVPLSAVRVYTSPFSRTVETASIAAAAAGLDPAAIQVSLLHWQQLHSSLLFVAIFIADLTC
jgi:hypothetical protein